jgi:hypothetical protein
LYKIIDLSSKNPVDRFEPKFSFTNNLHVFLAGADVTPWDYISVKYGTSNTGHYTVVRRYECRLITPYNYHVINMSIFEVGLRSSSNDKCCD